MAEVTATGGEAESLYRGIEQTTLPFWEAGAKGDLQIQQCSQCHEHYFYPRAFCPFCASSDVEWRPCSGNGTIYSYTILTKTNPGLTVIAYVTLAEGPTLLTRIEDAGPADVCIGLPVTATFKTSEAHLPQLIFKPAAT